MKQYTKTITVQAVQWTGENLEEVKAFCNDEAAYVGGPSGHVRARFTMRAAVGAMIVHDPSTGCYWSETDEDFTRDYKEVTE